MNPKGPGKASQGRPKLGLQDLGVQHRSNRISPLQMVVSAENSGGTTLCSFAHEPWA